MPSKELVRSVGLNPAPLCALIRLFAPPVSSKSRNTTNPPVPQSENEPITHACSPGTPRNVIGFPYSPRICVVTCPKIYVPPINQNVSAARPTEPESAVVKSYGLVRVPSPL